MSTFVGQCNHSVVIRKQFNASKGFQQYFNFRFVNCKSNLWPKQHKIIKNKNKTKQKKERKKMMTKNTKKEKAKTKYDKIRKGII